MEFTGRCRMPPCLLLRPHLRQARGLGRSLHLGQEFRADAREHEDPWRLVQTQGINHFVLHVYVHQPYAVQPGLVPWFGADFNRNSTWFAEYGKGWTDYLRRCCALLQTGTHAADVAYFFGEDTPRMNGLQSPALPAGYDFDYINAEILLTHATCQNGRLTLPNGQSYRVLVLPPSDTMTPRLLARIETFVRQGLVLVGAPRKVAEPSRLSGATASVVVTRLG